MHRSALAYSRPLALEAKATEYCIVYEGDDLNHPCIVESGLDFQAAEGQIRKLALHCAAIPNKHHILLVDDGLYRIETAAVARKWLLPDPEGIL